MRAFAVAALAVAGLTHYYAAADGPRSIWSVGLGRNGSFGNSAHNYEDDNVHLGSTMLLTTALVAAVLTAISNQLVGLSRPKSLRSVFYILAQKEPLSLSTTSMRLSRNGKPISWRWEDISTEAAEPLATALSFHNPKRAILSPHGLSSRQKICLAKYEARAF
jgi:hypothetical protein